MRIRKILDGLVGSFIYSAWMLDVGRESENPMSGSTELFIDGVRRPEDYLKEILERKEVNFVEYVEPRSEKKERREYGNWGIESERARRREEDVRLVLKAGRGLVREIKLRLRIYR